MSTGLNCEYVEYNPGEWMLVLEEWNAPKSAWDWREHARGYGFFASCEDAARFLDEHFPNPGGSITIPNDAVNPDDPVLAIRAEEAEVNRTLYVRPKPATPLRRFRY